MTAGDGAMRVGGDPPNDGRGLERDHDVPDEGHEGAEGDERENDGEPAESSGTRGPDLAEPRQDHEREREGGEEPGEGALGDAIGAERPQYSGRKLLGGKGQCHERDGEREARHGDRRRCDGLEHGASRGSVGEPEEPQLDLRAAVDLRGEEGKDDRRERLPRTVARMRCALPRAGASIGRPGAGGGAGRSFSSC